jgi:hypothetical protein
VSDRSKAKLCAFPLGIEGYIKYDKQDQQGKAAQVKFCSLLVRGQVNFGG